MHWKTLLLVFLLFILGYTKALATVGEWCCPPRGMSTQPGFYNVVTRQCEYSDPNGTIYTDPSCNSSTEICDTTWHCAAMPTNPPLSPTPNPGNGPCNDPNDTCCTRTMYNPEGHPYTEYYCELPLAPNTQDAACICQTANIGITPTPKDAIFRICNTIPATQPTQQKACQDCVTTIGGVYTALGCLPTSPEAFTGSVLTLALGLGGGLALLLMLYGSFLVSTSAGNPEQSQKGKEVVTGAIMGLLFIIFSVVLLKLIGIDILHLPGF